MKYLVDANVLSEATKPIPSKLVLNWLQANQNDLLVNPIILGELQFGILQLPNGQRKDDLLAWFERGMTSIPGLVIDVETSQCWAKMLVSLRAKGVSMPVKDSLIAASAIQHGLAIATRNIRDFAESGVRLVNPFEGSGDS